MIPSLVAIVLVVVASLLYRTLVLDHRLRIDRLSLFCIHGLSYKTPALTIAIGKFDLRLKLPSRLNPSWAVITISDYEYKDAACQVSMDSCITKLWFFPVLFRFSFGPWMDARIEGFAMRVYNSINTPPLLQETRRHLVVSTLNGETVRMGRMSTRFMFGKDAEVPVPPGTTEKAGEDDGWGQKKRSSQEQGAGTAQRGTERLSSAESNGIAENGKEKTITYERDDVRVRLTLEQWQMVTLNHRMYAFGEIQGELRRSWLDDRGSVVVIMKDISWVKLPYTDEPLGKGGSTLWEIARAIWYFPSNLFTFARDPISIADIHVGRFDVTFCNFRLRDAELLKQGAIRLKQEHLELESRHPGIVGDFAWDMFVHGIQSMCKE